MSTSTSNNKEFFLIRHAESMGNIGLDPGFDPLLSPLGHAQAQACAQLMREYCDECTLILASPFERCLMTADEIASASELTYTIEPDIQEYFKADWFPIKKVQFESLEQKAKKHPLASIEANAPSQWWPEKNESADEFYLRISMFRNHLINNSVFNAEKIVCIGHWASVQALAYSMVPNIDMPFVKNAAVTKINYSESRFNADFVNLEK